MPSKKSTALVSTDMIDRKKGNGARFHVDFIGLVASLKAAGLSDEYIESKLKVKPQTLKRWRKNNPELERAWQDGKCEALKHLVATAYQVATGYDFQETEEVYKVEKDDKGKSVENLVKRSRKTKRQKPDTAVLIFMLCNLVQGFKNIKNVEVTEKKKVESLELKGEVSAEQIMQLAGALVNQAPQDSAKRKIVESEVVDGD